MEALDGKKNSNMLIAHPTGTGKSLPMLLLGLFLPEGIFSNSCNLRKSYLMSCSGSTTLIVPPLTTIEAQLLNDCERLGIPAVAGSKVFLSYLSFIHVQGEFFDGFPLKMSLDLTLPKFLSLSTLKVLLYHGGGRGSQGFLRSFWKWLTNIVFHPAGSQHVWESNEAVSPDCHCQCGVLG